MLNITYVLPGIVYSQTADTGTGTDVNTQIVYAVDHLKVMIGTVKEDYCV